MTPEQFEAVAKLIRAREPVKSAVYRVLVDGISGAAASRETGVKPNAISNSLQRFRAADSVIRAAYESAKNS